MTPANFPTPGDRSARAEMTSLGLSCRRVPVLAVALGILALLVVSSAVSALVAL